tara:strand:+ start:559 stop:1542 length:984 start_codon:yes stop_codon:yes gene_type:complete
LKKLKVALIGCGIVGLRRVKYFDKKFSLVACADSRINYLKKKFSSKNLFLTKDWKKILTIKDLDAVFIATYHSLQSEIIKTFIKKKIHIFCEKPGGTSFLETSKLLNLTKNNKNLCLKIGFNHRFHPSFILAKKIIKKKQIGEIMYIRAVYGHGGRKNYHKEWRFNKKLSGGGELIDKGSHLIDLSRLFLGNLKVHSSFTPRYFWKIKLEDNCFIALKNNKNNFSYLHASSTEWKNKFLFEIFCKYGKIEISGLGKSYGKEKLILYKMKKNMGIPDKKQYVFSQFESDSSWKTEIDDFYNCIIKSNQCNPSLIDVYKNLKIIDKIYK